MAAGESRLNPTHGPRILTAGLRDDSKTGTTEHTLTIHRSIACGERVIRDENGYSSS